MSTVATNTTQPPEVEDVLRQWVTFKLGPQEHALPVDSVQEVLRVTEIAPVPGAAYYMLGVMNLRGAIVTVIDGRARFDMPIAPASNQQRILVIRLRNFAIGMLVDCVTDVIELRDSEIEPMSGVSTQQPDAPLLGVAYQDDGFIVLADTQALVDPEKGVV